MIFPIRVGLFVKNNSPIKTIADMKGKTVAYGFTSQEIIQKTVDAMLATAGLTAKDMKTVLVPNLIRGVDELIAGRVDVTTFAVGSAKVAEADAAVGIRYVGLPEGPKQLEALRKEFPTAYFGKVAPQPNYPGVKEPISIMFYDYTIFASADMPAERVKQDPQADRREQGRLGRGASAVPRHGRRSPVQQHQGSLSRRRHRLFQGKGNRGDEVIGSCKSA